MTEKPKADFEGVKTFESAFCLATASGKSDAEVSFILAKYVFTAKRRAALKKAQRASAAKRRKKGRRRKR